MAMCAARIWAALYPAESNHVLPLEALRAPNVCFYVARGEDGMALLAPLRGVAGAPVDRGGRALPGSLTAMLNWYRAILRRQPAMPAPGSITVPVRILWGMQDKYGLAEPAEASVKLCRNGRIGYLPEASHWVLRDAPDQVSRTLLAFLGEPAG